MFFNSLTYAGEATGLNHAGIQNIDGTNVWDLTKAEIEGRRHISGLDPHPEEIPARL